MESTTRRTLTWTKAPTFRSLVLMVPACARSS